MKHSLSEIESLALKQWHIPSLRPAQKQVISHMLEGDVPSNDHKGEVVILPTGSGKSLCFLLPSMVLEGCTLVIYPLLSLMNDQLSKLLSHGIECVVIQGGQSETEREAGWKKLQAGKARLIITNAECLLIPTIFSHLLRISFSLVVVDEAHTVVQWGSGFRPSYHSLGTLLSSLEIRQLFAFTATASEPLVERLTTSLFLGHKPNVFRSSSDRTGIIYHTERTLSKGHTLKLLLSSSAVRPAVVFCRKRQETCSYALHFSYALPDVPVRYYHAGMSKEEREAVEAWFAKSSDGVLFATCAYGMGVDKGNIRMVVHTFLPSDAESYLQESGRAGRDGNKADAVMLLDSVDEKKESKLVKVFTGTTCIRRGLLALMGETVEKCSGCDVCNPRKNREREGEHTLLKTITLHQGALTEMDLPTLVESWSESEAEEAVRNMVQEGMVRRKKGRLYGKRSCIFRHVVAYCKHGGRDGNGT